MLTSIDFPLPEPWACFALHNEPGDLSPAEQQECRAYLAEYGASPGAIASIEDDASFTWSPPAGLLAGFFVTATILKGRLPPRGGGGAMLKRYVGISYDGVEGGDAGERMDFSSQEEVYGFIRCLEHLGKDGRIAQQQVYYDADNGEWLTKAERQAAREAVA